MTTAALDVNELIREVLSLLRGDLENHRIGVDAALPDGLPLVSANAVELRQVIVNLITNAADAMSTVMNRQRLLRLRTQAHEPGGLLITVEDTGSGIDPRHADRIFEPFFTTKPVGQGTGQGLAFVYSTIVKRHGGSVTFETESDKGTTFVLRLPLAPRTAENE